MREEEEKKKFSYANKCTESNFNNFATFGAVAGVKNSWT